jgi:hypothetical protein
MIDPMRPTPSAQPMPVERIAVGYMPAASAFIPICAPTTPKPARKVAGIRIHGSPAPIAMATMKSADPV